MPGPSAQAPDPEALPGDTHSWFSGILLATGLWIVGLVGASVLPLDAALSEIAGLVMVIAWIVLPVATYYDAQYVATRGEWHPQATLWAAGMLIPGGNLLIVAYYLFRRYGAVGIP